MRNQICLIKNSDIRNFVDICTLLDGKIEVYSPKSGYRVNAKSFLGVLLAATEWQDDVWVESEKDYYQKLKNFIVEQENDGAYIHE